MIVSAPVGAGALPVVDELRHANDRLKAALGDDVLPGVGPAAHSTSERSTSSGVEIVSDEAVELDGQKSARLVVTTDEEVEGFQIVRAIVCSEVPVSRVVARDTQTYFGILLDDNNRKPIARLWFNRSKKYLGIFDENKRETACPSTARRTFTSTLTSCEERSPAT